MLMVWEKKEKGNEIVMESPLVSMTPAVEKSVHIATLDFCCFISHVYVIISISDHHYYYVLYNSSYIHKTSKV